MTTARQRILAVIGRRGTTSASQIGRSLNMSAAAVRHHLSILRQDGRVTEDHVEPRRGRGRPEKIYRLSDRLLGENLAGLSDVLLKTWLEGLPPRRRESALRSLGERLAGQAGALESSPGAAKRLVELTERLNGLNYQARWEAGARGPRVLLGHCPYAAIIEGHPELCAVDTAFLGALMGAPLEQLMKIERKPGGATHCIFATPDAAARDQG